MSLFNRHNSLLIIETKFIVMQNPYQIPKSDITVNNANFYKLSIKYGVKLLLLAWRLFWQAPFLWIGLSIVFWIITASLLITPYLSLFIIPIAFLYINTIYYLSYQLYHKKPASIGDCIIFISNHTVKLMVILIIIPLMSIALYSVLFAIIWGLMWVYEQLFDNVVFLNFWIRIEPNTPKMYVWLGSMFVSWILLQPIIMATLFSPMLILFKNQKPLQALLPSFKAYFINILPLVLYSFISLCLIAMIGILLLYQGMFIVLILPLLPIIFIGFLIAYCQIFEQNHTVKNDTQ